MNASERLFFEKMKEGQFSVDDLGHVWRHSKGRKRRAEKKGRYLQIGFNPAKARRWVHAHRIVWMAHNGRDIPDGMQINHKDGDKHNNHPDNLELVTQSQNGLHATRVLGLNRGERHGAAKLTRDDVKTIRWLCRGAHMSRREIADLYGVDQSNITLIAQGKTWKHVSLSF